MTLDEIKDQYAIEKGFNNWEGFIMEQPVYRYEGYTDEVAKRYAELKSQDVTKQVGYYIEILKNLDLKNIGVVLGIGNNKSVSKNLLPKIKELQEQNSELAKELAHVVKALKTVSSFGATTPIIEHAEGILTKHNHLNKK